VQASPIVSLHAEREGSGRRIVLVHGFAQTRDCWGSVASDLAADHEVVRVDAPGHGQSSSVVAGLDDGARLIAEAGGPGTYLGYSMGARFCLHVALEVPEIVRGLVLLGATPGIEDRAERESRVARDRDQVQRLRADGIDAFLDEWLANPLFAGLSPEARFLEQRRENTVEGLASSLERAGTGAQTPRWDELPSLVMPVLVAAGERDERFAAIARRMVDAIGTRATLALIPEAGHAAHLEQPATFVSAVRRWLGANGL
jgi:2-succinyl-6-hydroxy-2,4-cyclohexadiene-1-carboxylate synthase